ncbi:MAG TPA: hypothetical protein VIO61_16330 [Anaerolineaceae bacterium]
MYEKYDATTSRSRYASEINLRVKMLERKATMVRWAERRAMQKSGSALSSLMKSVVYSLKSFLA